MLSKFLLVVMLLLPLQGIYAQSSLATFTADVEESTLSFGAQTPAQPLPRNLRLFVWNVHKAGDNQMYQDFAQSSSNPDLALFQESISNASYIQQLSASVPYLGWTMAKCFKQSNSEWTGVATGSRVKPLREEVIFSDVREPFINTPKTILLSEYAVEDSATTLLVANIHAINFVGPGTYKVQIKQLVEKIKNHPGPLIVAGDFNTWDLDRKAILKAFFTPLGLRKLNTPASFMDLDHIFVRGLEAKTIHNLSHVESSDHAPLMVDLYFLGNF